MKPVKPPVLYTKEIWGHNAATASSKKILMATQRSFLRVAARTYSTITTSALQRIADEATRGEVDEIHIDEWLFKNKVKIRVERRANTLEVWQI